MHKEMNGQSTHMSLPSDGTGIVLYQHGQTLGRIEARLDYMDRRIQKIETGSLLGLTPTHFIQIGIGLTVVGAAITGRISWGESLPVIGRLFGG